MEVVRIGEKVMRLKAYICSAKKCRRKKYDCDGWVKGER